MVVQIRTEGSYACKDRVVARRLFRSRRYMIKNFEEFARWNLILFSKKKYLEIKLKYFLVFRNGRGKILSDSWQWIEHVVSTHNPDPTPSDYPRAFQASPAFGSLYGAEYQFSYRNIAIDDDVPCASCLSTHASSVIMIPAKTTCPTGWTVQYSGVLTADANWPDHTGREFLCLDENPEYMTEGARM